MRIQRSRVRGATRGARIWGYPLRVPPIRTGTILLVSLLSGVTFAAAPPDEGVELRYPEDRDRRAVERPRSGAGAPPGEMRGPKPSGRVAELPTGRPHRPGPDSDPDRDSEDPASDDDRWRDIVHRAREAARRAWRSYVFDDGRREYFEVGFYRGLHDALDTPGLGVWDFDRGWSRGEGDPQATVEGRRRGVNEAEATARRLARSEVESQFLDLSREPVVAAFLPAVASAPDAGSPYSVAPTLAAVFSGTPLHGHVHDPLARGLSDGWDVYRHRSWRDLYDDGWRHHPHPEERRGLDRAERKLFDDVYRGELLRLEHDYRGAFDDAHARGFDEGWSYGAYVTSELEYRRGYQAGFEERFAAETEAGYRTELPRFYERFYRTEFDAWARQPRPRIESVALRDGNDDGVFEPGEEVVVAARVVNYGGAGGTLAMSAEGSAFGEAFRGSMELERRSVAESPPRIVVVVDESARRKETSTVVVRVGSAEREVDLYVSYPLEIRREFGRLEIVSLDGRVFGSVEVTNTSRRAVDAVLEVVPSTEPGAVRTRELGQLEAGSTRSVDFEIDGLRPLDLLDGSVTLEALARSRGRTEDRLTESLPRLGTDLANRDLVLWFVRAVGEQRTVDWSRAQNLMLDRLEIDWYAAVSANGNPYRFDRKNRAATTALGDLVAATRGLSRGPASPVFSSLVAQIESLTRTFPGTHPLLRKSMRRLAQDLDG